MKELQNHLTRVSCFTYLSKVDFTQNFSLKQPYWAAHGVLSLKEDEKWDIGKPNRVKMSPMIFIHVIPFQEDTGNNSDDRASKRGHVSRVNGNSTIRSAECLSKRKLPHMSMEKWSWQK